MRPTITRLAALLAPLLAAGCFDSPTGGSLDAAQRQLDAARARWDTAALDNYDFEYQRLCSCPPEYLEPVVLRVRADTVQAVLELTGGDPIQGAPAGVYLTIDEIFDLIQAALDEPADRVNATFDTDLSYPVITQVDYAFGVGDDEVEIRAANLAEVVP